MKGGGISDAPPIWGEGSQNLKEKALSGGVISSGSQAVLLLLNLASIVVLARLLPPEDFGLVAMVTTVMGFLRIFNDAGLSTATVQREAINHAQVSNLFWTNVVLGGSATLILALLAPGIAWFYGDERLTAVTLVLSVSFILTALTVQHLALLKREMLFGRIASIQLSAAATALVVGVLMAHNGYGIWALVGMQLSTPLVSVVLTWFISKWRPQPPRRGSGTRSLLGFGANLTASSLIWSIARGTDSVLIGKFFGATALGFYSRAAALLLRPLEYAMTPIESVMVPVLSRLQLQTERYRRIALQAYDVIAICGFLAAGILIPLARPITLAALGANWEDASPIFAGFCLIAIYVPLASVGTWLMTSQGRGRDMLLLSTLGSASTFLSFLAGLPFGPAGVAVSYSLSCIFLALPLNYLIAGRKGPVSAKDLWTRFFTHVPLLAFVFVATWVSIFALAEATLMSQLAVPIGTGLLAGGLFILLYPPTRRSVRCFVDAAREVFETRRGTQAVRSQVD